MKLRLLLLGIAGLLISCQNVQRPEKPDDLIPRDKMVSIFYDAYLANAAKSINNKTLRQMGIRLDSIIYKKHDIDSVQFAKSNEYYSLDLDEYAAMFSDLEAKLVVQQAQLDSIKEVKRGKNRERNEKSIQSKTPLGKNPAQIDSMVKRTKRTLIDPVQSEEEVDSLEE